MEATRPHFKKSKELEMQVDGCVFLFIFFQIIKKILKLLWKCKNPFTLVNRGGWCFELTSHLHCFCLVPRIWGQQYSSPQLYLALQWEPESNNLRWNLYSFCILRLPYTRKLEHLNVNRHLRCQFLVENPWFNSIGIFTWLLLFWRFCN